MGSAPMIALSPSGCPAAPSPSDAPPPFLRKQESILGRGGGPGPASPFWVPACAGTTWFHRHSCGSRNPSRGPTSPLWVPACAGTTRPTVFLRKQESILGAWRTWRRASGRCDVGAVRAPLRRGCPLSRGGYGAGSAVSTVIPRKQESIWARGRWPRPTSPFWVWKRGAGIHPPQSPKFPLQVAQNRLANR